MWMLGRLFDVKCWPNTVHFLSDASKLLKSSAFGLGVSKEVPNRMQLTGWPKIELL